MPASPQSRRAMTVRNRTPRVDYYKFDDVMDGTPRLDQKRIRIGNESVSLLNSSYRKSKWTSKRFITVICLALLSVAAIGGFLFYNRGSLHHLTDLTTNLRGTVGKFSLQDIPTVTIPAEKDTNEILPLAAPAIIKNLRGSQQIEPVVEEIQAETSNDGEPDVVIVPVDDENIIMENENEEITEQPESPPSVVESTIPDVPTESQQNAGNLRGAASSTTATPPSPPKDKRKKKRSATTTTQEPPSSTTAAPPKKKKSKRRKAEGDA